MALLLLLLRALEAGAQSLPGGNEAAAREAGREQGQVKLCASNMEWHWPREGTHGALVQAIHTLAVAACCCCWQA